MLGRELSWQYGTLEFVNTPLGDVVDEVGRYTSKTLVIEDSELESYPVTIIARTDNIDALLSNLGISTELFSVTYPSNGDVLTSISRPCAQLRCCERSYIVVLIARARYICATKTLLSTTYTSLEFFYGNFL